MSKHLRSARETAERALEREMLTKDICPVVFQSPSTVLALLDVFDEAYKLASLCEDVREMRMGGVDPQSAQATEIRAALDRQVIAVARAADRAEDAAP